MAAKAVAPPLFSPSILAQSWEIAGLRQRLLFTLGALAVFRLGAQIPIWGVNAIALKQLASNQLLGFLDMFSGGALGSLSILALGIGPYITSSIIIQLLTVVIPRLEEMQKEEGEAGRRKIAQMTRYSTVALALFQAVVVIRLFTATPGVLLPGVNPPLFYTLATISLVAGSLFTLWLSELITDRGIGNGGSLLIFVGILASLPFYATQTAQLVAGDPQRSFNLVLLLLIYLVSIVLIIILQEAVRKIFIVNAKRQVGNKIYGGQSSYIPFKINPAGVMPIIFAFAMLAFPQTLIQLVQNMKMSGVVEQVIEWYTLTLGPGKPLYLLLEFTLIVFFTFFYASIVPSMQPKEIAQQLKKFGSSIPGVKPGKPTSDVLEVVIGRVMWIGAIGLALITLLASSATSMTGITTLSGLGSTALIIMVGVALDTVNQVRVHLLAKQYEGFLKTMSTLDNVVFFPFISRPSAGKGTQTTLLAERQDLPRLDMGSLLREIAKEDSPLGQSVQARLSQGQLVELDTVMDVLRDGIEKQLRARNTHAALGFILDGFPRNLPQAESLLVLCESSGARIATAIYLDVPVEVIVERAANRRICEQCGTIYNVAFKPPTQAGICDVCGSDRLTQRADDQPDKVQARLRSFDEETEPVLELLERDGRHLVTHIDGNRPVETVYDEIAQAVEVSMHRFATASATPSH